jgi:predicted nucleic acid-binding protein
MITLVDSNVILDIVTNDPLWFEWSSDALIRAADESALAINPIIYAEVSIGYSEIEVVEDLLPARDFRRLELPYEAAFLAGKAFLKYRRRGGTRNAPLPDFYIGAHAAITGARLLTRDPRRYRTYFPTIEVLTPPSRGRTS